MRHIERLLHLVQKMLLGHFVAVQFQAERVEPNLCQSLLHHFKGGHLLRHEKHSFALIQCIGYHVGDGLALACSRGAVEDEALASSTLYHCLHLRRVDIDRDTEVGRQVSLVNITRIHNIIARLQSHTTLHQTLQHIAFLQFLSIGMDIVPHHELVEIE